MDISRNAKKEAGESEQITGINTFKYEMPVKKPVRKGTLRVDQSQQRHKQGGL